MCAYENGTMLVRKLHVEKEVTCSYVEILNRFICQKCGMKVKEGCKRVEGRLRRACSEIKNKFMHKNGNNYRKLCQNDLKLTLQLDDLETLLKMECQLKEKESLIDNLQDDKTILTERCEVLLNKSIESQAGEKTANENLSKADALATELMTENHNLHQYIERLGQQLDFQNNGAKLTQIGE